MEKHQRIAIVIFLAVVGYVYWRDEQQEALAKALILLAFLTGILIYRITAWLSGFGLPEYFARDFGSENRPGPYAFFFWLLYLIACGFIVFDLSLY